MFKVLAYGITHVGRERKNNEDAYRIAPDAGLFLVCDGMGGHASGEVASQIAADTMVRFVAMDRFRGDFRWPAEAGMLATEEARALDAAVRLANHEIFESAQANPLHKGMGTTIVGMLAGPHRLGLVHVGDSRIYRFRDGDFEQLTDDHSLLNHYLRTRPMSAQQIRQFAGKNVIVRAVGLRDAVEPDVQVQDYRSGDVYLLCSDGLTDMVPDEGIAQALRDGEGDLEKTAAQLIELALDGGGKDNVTVLLLRVVEVPGPARVTPYGRETLTMEVPVVDDTSPGFDIRQSERPGVDEETLPDFSVPQTKALRPFERTQETARPAWATHAEPPQPWGEPRPGEPAPADHVAGQPPGGEQRAEPAPPADGTRRPLVVTNRMPKVTVGTDDETEPLARAARQSGLAEAEVQRVAAADTDRLPPSHRQTPSRGTPGPVAQDQDETTIPIPPNPLGIDFVPAAPPPFKRTQVQRPPKTPGDAPGRAPGDDGED